MSKHHKNKHHQSTESVQHSSPSGESRQNTGSLQEEISHKAYSLYLDAGSPDGHALEHWLAAEAMVKQARLHT